MGPIQRNFQSGFSAASTTAIFRKRRPTEYRPRSKGAVASRTTNMRGSQSRIHATRTSQAQMETIDCQRRNTLHFPVETVAGEPYTGNEFMATGASDTPDKDVDGEVEHPDLGKLED